MSYKHIVVILDDSSHSPERLQFALRLAVVHDSHLTALHISNMPFDPAHSYALTQPVYSQYLEVMAARQQQAHDEFVTLLKTAGLRHDWQGSNSYNSNAAIAFTRCADLIIVGQHDAHDATSYLDDSFLSQLLIKAGRPVLIIPRFAEPAAHFATILIAWDGGRNAARAVADALPLLRRAERIMVLTVAAAHHDSQTAPLPLPNIVDFLSQHQLHAEMINSDAQVSVGAWLLDRAEGLDLKADLIVAGAGGSSLLKDFSLGGVTRFLLHKSCIPLLMSN
jgi:nucleotide-binding universal stress UspA family protein